MTHSERYSGGFARVNVVAGLSVIALIAILGWSAIDSYRQKKVDLNATTPISKIIAHESKQSTTYVDPGEGLAYELEEGQEGDSISSMSQNAIAQVAGNYLIAKQAGNYTPEKAAQIGEEISATLSAPVSYLPYLETNVETTSDVSYARMLQYRADLQITLAPLLENKRSEFEIFAQYIQTKDQVYLEELRTVAKNYTKAAQSTKSVVVPQDALSYHVGIVNAMLQFAATLEAMAGHASDPVASAALLKTYNQAEQNMLTSFDRLAQYYANKKQ